MKLAWLAPIAAACATSSPPAAPPPVATVEKAPATSAPPAPPARPASPYPASQRQPVTDSYGEVKVVDDYRWLEDAGAASVRDWTAAQNQLMRSRLDALPDRPKIHARVAELLSNRAPSYGDVRVIGGGVLAFERHPPKQQALLVALSDPANPATERVVLDPNELDPTGKTAIDFFVPPGRSCCAPARMSATASAARSLR